VADRRRTDLWREPASADYVGDEVHAVAARIVSHLREGRCALLAAYFSVGDEMRGLRTSAAIGRRAIARLARELDMDKSGLQKWGRVAELIRGEERAAICNAGDKLGLPLTPSLLLELERVRNRNARMELARAVLNEGLSVRNLRERISELNRERRRRDDSKGRNFNALRSART
jgi:hypothetical protein